MLMHFFERRKLRVYRIEARRLRDGMLIGCTLQALNLEDAEREALFQFPITHYGNLRVYL